jgi:hypothetical protein
MCGSLYKASRLSSFLCPQRVVSRRVVYSGGHRASLVGFGWKPFNRIEDLTLTEEMIAFRTLLEESADADLLREMIGFTAQR